MTNLSKIKRERMLAYLEQLKTLNDDEEHIRAITEIENALTEKKYGLVWEEHSEEVNEMLAHNIPVFIEDETRKIVADEEEPYNFLLEGDNLHSLKLLEKTHKGKIDLIYIDPPYNRGKRDFRYNDVYIGEEDSYRHSKWLSFMKKRLEISRLLLSDFGVIFISIDDNEQAQLKLLCEEIFGIENFIGMAIHKNNSNKNQSNFLGVTTEYVLIYCKDLVSFKNNVKEWRINKSGAKDISKKFNQLSKMGLSLEEIEEEIKDMYKRPKYSHLSRWNKVDENGVFKDSDLSRNNGPKNYTIINPETGLPVVVPERGWGKSYDELIRLQKEDLIWYGDPNTPPGLKLYIQDDTMSVVDSFWYYDNSIDTKNLRKMFGKIVFENPKPQEMLKDILSFAAKRDSIVLDFFAGSGTTGHAVAQLNAEDGGNRRYILCTNNENNICEEVTYQRLKNIQTDLPHNLKYFKTDFIKKFNQDESISSLMMEHIKELIELENHIEIDGKKVIMLEHEEQLPKVLESIQEGGKLFIPSGFFLSQTDQAILDKKDITVIEIPEYYFRNELREVGEL